MVLKIESERERRIKEVKEEINRLRQKYGMDFDEFYEIVESMREEELAEKIGIDELEVLEDFNKWIDLEIEKEKLKVQ